jgi:hypothetical protein
LRSGVRPQKALPRRSGVDEDTSTEVACHNATTEPEKVKQCPVATNNIVESIPGTRQQRQRVCMTNSARAEALVRMQRSVIVPGEPFPGTRGKRAREKRFSHPTFSDGHEGPAFLRPHCPEIRARLNNVVTGASSLDPQCPRLQEIRRTRGAPTNSASRRSGE